jgi:hypothetical protein
MSSCNITSFRPSGIDGNSTNFRSKCFITDINSRKPEDWREASRRCQEWNLGHLAQGVDRDMNTFKASQWDCMTPPDAYEDNRSWGEKVKDGTKLGLEKAVDSVKDAFDFGIPDWLKYGAWALVALFALVLLSLIVGLFK